MCDAIVFQHVGDMQRQHSSVCSSSPPSLWWEIGLNPSCSDNVSSLLSSSPPPSPNYSTAFSMPSTTQPAAYPLFLCCEDLCGWEKKTTECSLLCKCSFLFQMWTVTLSLEVKCRGENSEPDMWKWHGRCKAVGYSKFCCFPKCFDFICVSIALSSMGIYQDRNRDGN